MDSLILCHSLKKRIPVLWLLLYVVDSFGDIRQRAIDIENNNFLSHYIVLYYW